MFPVSRGTLFGQDNPLTWLGQNQASLLGADIDRFGWVDG